LTFLVVRGLTRASVLNSQKQQRPDIDPAAVTKHRSRRLANTKK